MKLGQFSQALQAFTQALESLAKADLDEKKLATWKKDLAKKMEGCQGKADVGESGRSPFFQTGVACCILSAYGYCVYI